MTERSQFDTDPEALAWARAHVQAEIDQCRRFERESKDPDVRKSWRRLANLMTMKFIGNSTCSIARFDQRKPVFYDSLDRAERSGS